MRLEPLRTPALQVIQAIRDELDRIVERLTTDNSNSDDRENIVLAAKNILNPSWQSYLIDWSK